MRHLRTFTLGVVLLLTGLSLFGCSSSSSDDSKGALNSTAPINNNAPEAKNAPAAPVDASIIDPGGGKKKGK